jgi:hypothetical protein
MNGASLTAEEKKRKERKGEERKGRKRKEDGVSCFKPSAGQRSNRQG